MDIRFAIIDLGSNSLRMSVFSVGKNGDWKLLKKVRETVRLSENMGEDNRLKEEAVNRVIKALNEFNAICDEYGCTFVKAITTAAVRKAVNKKEFLLRAKNEAGIDFEVISGEDEAYYSFLAVKNTVGIQNGVIIDTGGGSSEITLVRDGKLIKSVSLPLGAVVMTEQFADKSQVELYKYVSESIADIKWLCECESLPIYGIGGSARTGAMICKGRELRQQELDGLKIKYSSFAKIYQKIYNTHPEKRREIKGMDVSRADVILAGLTPCKALMDIIGSKNIIVCLAGVKEGVFFNIKDEIITKGG